MCDDEAIASDASRERGEARAIRQGKLRECGSCGTAQDPDEIGRCGCGRDICGECEEIRGKASSCAACAKEADDKAEEEDAHDAR